VTDPQVALFMLGLFIFLVFLGFPIAFTLMAMGIGFGYYAYFDAARQWRSFGRLEEGAGLWDRWSTWIEGFFNNRIFDLFINQTYTVMSNEVLTAVPLFLFMGYIVERANIVDRLFTTLNIAARNMPGSMVVAALVTCALFATATGIVGAVVTLMGLLALPAMLKARYDPSFASGIICAGGTLGILIPPSIMLIVYAASSGVSIVRLYAGALLPGLILVGLYITYVVGRSILQPSVAPKPTKEDVPEVPMLKLVIMLANLRISLEETKATVERSTLPQVFGDSTQLTQLFQNLIGNALKYRAQVTPRIEVRAERQGTEWLIAVSDNGIGIAPEHNERVFGMFQRLHGREEYPGTGIGLAICQKIVDQHGGRIWLESQPAQGSTFFFTLPAIEDRQ
jgi:TRAP-type mannitol/chloroaromatic compound transport system permease large subunit